MRATAEMAFKYVQQAYAVLSDPAARCAPQFTPCAPQFTPRAPQFTSHAPQFTPCGPRPAPCRRRSGRGTRTFSASEGVNSRGAGGSRGGLEGV